MPVGRILLQRLYRMNPFILNNGRGAISRRLARVCLWDGF
jgi:hypothetical protein